MGVSRRQLVALRAGGSAVPPDGGQAELRFADPACGFRLDVDDRLHG